MENIRSQQSKGHLERVPEANHGFFNPKTLLAQNTYVALREAEENLTRLGLDEQSRDQINYFSNEHSMILVSAVAPNPSDVAQNVDDAVSGRASAYSRKSRKTTALAPTAQAVHPLVSGVASLLRNVNGYSGSTQTDVYKIEPKLVRSSQRTKLALPQALYPTVSQPNQLGGICVSDSSDEPEEIDVDFQSRSESYLASIRARKQEDVQAMKERHVRHHRLKAEQLRSRNEITGKRELDELIRNSKQANNVDKCRFVEKCIRKIQSEKTQFVNCALMELTKHQTSKIARIQLDRNALIAEQERIRSNAAFKTLRDTRKAHEESKLQRNRKLRYDFCAELVKGVVRLAERIISQSTQTMRDGTIQYRRATFAPTEWAAIKCKEMTETERPPGARKSVNDHGAERSPPQHDEELTIDSGSVAAPSANRVSTAYAEELALADVELVKEKLETALSLQLKLNRGTPYTEKLLGVFVRGDPVLSGCSLLERVASYRAQPANGYVVLTPHLLMHLIFERKCDAIDLELLELKKLKEGLLFEMTKITAPKPKTKEVKGRDLPIPLNISNRLNEIQLRISSLEADREQHCVMSEAQAKIMDDLALGEALKNLIKDRLGLSKTESDFGRAEPQGVYLRLTRDSLCNHDSLKLATLLLVGFPSTERFFCSLEDEAFEEARFATASITLDGPTYLRRLSERELHWEDGQETNKTETGGSNVTKVIHPIFSPIVSSKSDDRESPFQRHEMRTCRFVRSMSWRDECRGDETSWLNHVAACERHGWGGSSVRPKVIADVHITQEMNDELICGAQLPLRVPGSTEQGAPLETLAAVSDRLCLLVSTAARDAFTTDEKGKCLEPTTLDAFLSRLPEIIPNLASARRIFFDGLETLQKTTGIVFAHIKKSSSEYETCSKTTDKNAFSWLQSCDSHRRKDMEAIDELVDGLRSDLVAQISEARQEFAKIKATLAETCKELGLLESTLSRLEREVLDGPFEALHLSTEHVNKTAALCIRRLFDFNTQGTQLPVPRSVREMLELTHPLTGKHYFDEALSKERHPSSIQAHFLQLLIETSVDDTVTLTSYRRLEVLCRALPSVSPDFAPAALGELKSTPHGPLPLSRATLLSGILCGRVGSLEGIPFANSLEVSKLALSAAGKFTYDVETFSSLEWWFDRSLARNLYSVFVIGGTLRVCDLLQFICTNPFHHPSFILQSWVNAISLFSGHGAASEIALNFSEVDLFFHPTVFDKRKLALLETLNSPNFSSGGIFSTRHLQTTAYGKDILSAANFHPSKI